MLSVDIPINILRKIKGTKGKLFDEYLKCNLKENDCPTLR